MNHVIFKANGQSEKFQKQKFLASIKTSCLAIGAPDAEAEICAEQVFKHISKWIANKPEFTSADLRLQAYQVLTIFNPEAAFFYRTYKQIL